MTEPKQANITEALKKVPSRFELITLAAQRARQIQEYEADLAKAKNKLDNMPPTDVAKARTKTGKGTKESRLEATVNTLKSNPVDIQVDVIEGEKPTVTAIREIQAGKITKDSIRRFEVLDSLSRNKTTFAEVLDQHEDQLGYGILGESVLDHDDLQILIANEEGGDDKKAPAKEFDAAKFVQKLTFGDMFENDEDLGDFDEDFGDDFDDDLDDFEDFDDE